VTKGIARFGLAAAIGLLPLASLAQSAGEARMPSAAEVVAALHAKEAEIGPGKQAFVEQQLALTEAQLAKFRPIYAEHQSALKRFNQRRLDNVVAYSRDYNADTLSDATAHQLALEALAIEREETFELEMTYAKARTVLPAKKAVHYLQIESKLRALVRFKQAAAVPVAKGK
jgi:Spy/CpxP family protein refolding chaperone